MPSFNFGRRTLLAGLTALALPLGAQASVQSAQALIQQAVSEVQAIINARGSEAQMIAQFQSILSRYGDMNAVSRFVVGPSWRDASGSEQGQLVQAFTGYLARKYGSQFNDFDGATLEILRAQDSGNAGVLVYSRVNLAGDSPVPVEWQVSDRSGNDRIVNLFVEGVSLLSTEREEVGAQLSRLGSIGALIGYLNSAG